MEKWQTTPASHRGKNLCCCPRTNTERRQDGEKVFQDREVAFEDRILERTPSMPCSCHRGCLRAHRRREQMFQNREVSGGSGEVERLLPRLQRGKSCCTSRRHGPSLSQDEEEFFQHGDMAGEGGPVDCLLSVLVSCRGL